MRELRVFGTHLRLRHTARQQVQNERDPNASASDAWPAAANRGINADTLQQIGHVSAFRFRHYDKLGTWIQVSEEVARTRLRHRRNPRPLLRKQIPHFAASHAGYDASPVD